MLDIRNGKITKILNLEFFEKTKKLFIQVCLEELTEKNSEMVLFSVGVLEFNPDYSKDYKVINDELHHNDLAAKAAFFKYCADMVRAGHIHKVEKPKGVLQ